MRSAKPTSSWRLILRSRSSPVRYSWIRYGTSSWSAEVVDGDDVAVLEVAGDLRLLEEAVADLLVVGGAGLDRDEALDVGVVGLEDGAEAADTDLLQRLRICRCFRCPCALWRILPRRLGRISPRVSPAPPPMRSGSSPAPAPPGSWARALRCSRTGEPAPLDRPAGLSPAGAPWLVDYDLDPGRGAALRDALPARSWSLWRYRELLPVRDFAARVDLGEGGTPLNRVERLSSAGGAEVWIKDESGNPTGSFKARGLSLAVNRARELGAPGVQLPSAGNAALAAGGLCRRGGTAGPRGAAGRHAARHRGALPGRRRRGDRIAGNPGGRGTAAGGDAGRVLGPLDAARALSGGGQEDDGLRARRAARLAAAGLDRLSDRRRHRHRRHAQGVRRAGARSA